MIRVVLIFLFQLFLVVFSAGQALPDTTAKNAQRIRKDTAAPVKVSPSPSSPAYSVSKRPGDTVSRVYDPNLSFVYQLIKDTYKKQLFYGFGSPILNIRSEKKQFHGKEGLFYLLICLLLLFALFRLAFIKYLNDLYRLFFRTTLKQRQIREQLLQTPLPSLLLNFFFIVIGGFYIDFVLYHFKLGPGNGFWLLFVYSSIALGLIYLIKFLGLKFCGWLFNVAEATDSYVFIVFITNKILGIFLLPFLILLAFSEGAVYDIAFTISWCGVAGLLVYRFVLSYSTVRNQIKLKPFHFFLYLCAFELTPLLLIYKVLLKFF